MKLAKLLGQFDRGALTRHELLIRVCQAAADYPPERIAVALPHDLMDNIRVWSMTPPESPEKCRVIQAGGLIGDLERWDRYFREQSRRLYDGLWRWHRYFADR